MSLTLISVNIQYDNHFDKLIPFLQKEQPDVLCVQEVFFADLPLLQRELGMSFVFYPSVQIVNQTAFVTAPRGIGGTAIFTRLAYSRALLLPYRGSSAVLPEFTKPNDSTLGLIVMELEHEGAAFRVATTHFTWSPDGKPNADQLADAAKLTSLLQQFPDIILVGDMNAPRGGEIFALLGAGLVDAIPPEVKTTLDPELHYSKGLELVVDVLFHSSHYQASAVRVVGGVSDHMAVVAELRRS